MLRVNDRIIPLLHRYGLKHVFPRITPRSKPRALMFSCSWHEQATSCIKLVTYPIITSTRVHLCWSQICPLKSWLSTLSPDFHFNLEPCLPFFVSTSAMLNLSHLSSNHSRPGNSSWSCMIKLHGKRNYVTGLPELSELRIRGLIGNETDTSSNDWFTCARVRPATHQLSFDSAERTPLSCSLQRRASGQCRTYFAQGQSSPQYHTTAVAMLDSSQDWPDLVSTASEVRLGNLSKTHFFIYSNGNFEYTHVFWILTTMFFSIYR
jgi:hypothetical protein